MVDDDTLTHSLRNAGAAFEIAPHAMDRIVEAALRDERATTSRSDGTVTSKLRRHSKVLAVAASLVAAVAIAIPLVPRHGTSNLTNHTASAGPEISLGPSKTIHRGPVVPSGLSFGGAKTINSDAFRPFSQRGTTTRIESNGTIDLLAKKGQFTSTLNALSALAQRLGGFVSSTQAHVEAHDASYATVTLQVPQSKFQVLLDQVQRLGHASSVQATSTDVTSQYVDLQARITSLEAGRQQYLVILRRASSISDILAVQSRINDIQLQIEQSQGELKLLSYATTYGTLSVNVAETFHHVVPPHHDSGVAKAWHDSVGGFVAGIEWVIRSTGPLFFALLLLSALAFLGRYSWRVARRRLL